jgi:hypothetical protein
VISNSTWAYSGHGRAATLGNYIISGNPAADFPTAAGTGGDPCLYCHDGAGVVHGDAVNYFRLRNFANPTYGKNGVCLVCHATTGAPGVAALTAGPASIFKTATQKVDKDHNGGSHTNLLTGGQFCWDCHNPHGDSTSTAGPIFMIRSNPAAVSDSTTGIPTTKTATAVTFTDYTSAKDFAKTAAPFNGICNVCHNSTMVHFNSAGSDGTHNTTTACTNCHKHSANTTVDGSAFAGGDCIGCHNLAQGSEREDAANHFSQQSHHVQGRAVAVTDCAVCHMEANTDGTPNATYHTQVPGKAVNLVVWANGMTPTTVIATSRPTTAWSGVAGTGGYINYTANSQRHEIAKINNVCFGCHNDSNRGFKPFNTYSTIRYSPEARLATPKAKTSILSRYSSTRTVAWSQSAYSSATGNIVKYGTNQKYRVTKALSAHGNASKNQMPAWSAVQDGPGEDSNMTNYSYSGTGKNRNVFCYDCHNSHGSAAAGITSSYSSATGRFKGGLLKTTTAGLGGYPNTYIPAARTVTYRQYSSKGTVVATFNPGASVCNDCHNSINPRGATLTKPWNILTTFSSSRSIGGYWSTPYFDNYTVNSTKRTPYKAGGASGTIKDQRKPMGGHFGSSINGTSAAHTHDVNGLCTSCHDPHGVSNALGTDRDHGIPLLKGTWVTTPYLEDKAGKPSHRGGGSRFGGVTNGGSVAGYHIDQNTFMTTPAPVNGGATTSAAKGNHRSQAFNALTVNAKTGANMPSAVVGLAPSNFAGLCLECHSQTALTGAPAATTTQPWKSLNRVHQSVSGWGPTNGTNVSNTIHAYTCAKCHAPHVSRLPRLLVTNCIDNTHVLQQVSAGINSVTSGTTTPGNIVQSVLTSSAMGAGRFPGGGANYSNNPTTSRNPGAWWFNAGPSTGTTPVYTTSCHNSATAGGATYSPENQHWNSKSPW